MSPLLTPLLPFLFRLIWTFLWVHSHQSSHLVLLYRVPLYSSVLDIRLLEVQILHIYRFWNQLSERSSGMWWGSLSYKNSRQKLENPKKLRFRFANPPTYTVDFKRADLLWTWERASVARWIRHLLMSQQLNGYVQCTNVYMYNEETPVTAKSSDCSCRVSRCGARRGRHAVDARVCGRVSCIDEHYTRVWFWLLILMLRFSKKKFSGEKLRLC